MIVRATTIQAATRVGRGCSYSRLSSGRTAIDSRCTGRPTQPGVIEGLCAESQTRSRDRPVHNGTLTSQRSPGISGASDVLCRLGEDRFARLIDLHVGPIRPLCRPPPPPNPPTSITTASPRDRRPGAAANLRTHRPTDIDQPSEQVCERCTGCMCGVTGTGRRPEARLPCRRIPQPGLSPASGAIR